MTSITLTRRDSGFRNVEPIYLVGDHYDGTSALDHPAVDYLLPEGFWVGHNDLGDQHVYDARGKHHAVVARNNGEPGLAGGERIIPLDRATEPAE